MLYLILLFLLGGCSGLSTFKHKNSYGNCRTPAEFIAGTKPCMTEQKRKDTTIHRRVN